MGDIYDSYPYQDEPEPQWMSPQEKDTLVYAIKTDPKFAKALIEALGLFTVRGRV